MSTFKPLFIIRTRRDRLGRKRWRWVLEAPNGEVIATSESYNSAAATYGGILAVQRYAANASTSRED